MEALSNRQREILKLIAEGYKSNKAITGLATDSTIKEKTVEKCVIGRSGTATARAGKGGNLRWN